MSFYSRFTASIGLESDRPAPAPVTAYRVVRTIQGELFATLVDPENFTAWCDVRGIIITGENRNPAQRAELQGQPKLHGFCGPMWDGNGVIRYEDRATNNALSL